MAVYTSAIQELIDEFGRLPGIGPKSAQRIALHLLKISEIDALRLATSIRIARERVSWCPRCFNFAEGGGECEICADQRRDKSLLCVVEEPRDVVAVERTNQFRGRYHVLGGAISPIDGIGAEQLHTGELLRRVGEEGVAEVILCTNPNLEGEATSLYLQARLHEVAPELRVTRLASGLPVGGDLEYADELTLTRAFEGRREASS